MQCCKTEIRLVSCRDLPGLRAVVVDKILKVKVYILVARWFGNQDYRADEPPQQLYLENFPCILLKAESIFDLIAVLTP